MDEKDTPRDDTRLSLHDESGMTRRDLMRRGAVVGGTLLWVAPAIQSIGSKAYAQDHGSPLCAACLSATINTGGGPVTTHVTFDPTARCCDCIAAGGGGLDALVLCAIGGSCAILSAGTGPCP